MQMKQEKTEPTNLPHQIVSNTHLFLSNQTYTKKYFKPQHMRHTRIPTNSHTHHAYIHVQNERQ